MYRVLDEIPLFEGIKSSDLKMISQYVISKTYKRNQEVILEGAPNKHLYIIKRGEIRISRFNDNDQDVVLAFLQPGDFFGELSILDEDICSATASTMQTSELLCIRQCHFKQILKTVPGLAYRLMCYMAQRIRFCDQCIENLNSHNSYKRIGCVLIYLAEQSGFRLNRSVVIKKLPFQHDIASLAGTSRETISRTLALMEDKAYIKKNGRHVVINDYPRFCEEFSS